MAFPAAGPVSIGLTIAGGTARVTVGDTVVLACDGVPGGGPAEAGAWGIAALSAGPGVTGHVAVDAITVTRSR